PSPSHSSLAHFNKRYISLVQPYTSVHCSTHTATTNITTLSLHDALPICQRSLRAGDLEANLILAARRHLRHRAAARRPAAKTQQDRKSTRLNSSHQIISYAVFCLKKKKTSTEIRKKRKLSKRRQARLRQS